VVTSRLPGQACPLRVNGFRFGRALAGVARSILFHTHSLSGASPDWPAVQHRSAPSQDHHAESLKIMRWFWIDRFIEFESGRQAKAIKNVSLSEEHLHDHFPGFPVMPCSLIMEGMAQTGGILLGETHQFQHLVFLAKIPKFISHRNARPGDQLVYTASLIEAREEGGMAAVTAHCGEELVAEAEIVFAHLSPAEAGIPGGVSQKNVVEVGLAGILADAGIKKAE